MINKYEIVKEVGNGNFSSVYLVRNRESGEFFAMKVMKTHHNIGVREAQFLKKFDHPNIVKLYDFESDPSFGQTKMILQYFPQNTLELYENQKYGLKQQQIKCLLFQTALGLAYIHERGIIHRDIKPENIVIDKSKAQILLIDFGLAIHSDKINTDYVATRWYRAPQNLLGTKQYTTAIDVFSLACVIIQLYLGSPLFPGDDNLDQLYKIFNILGEPTQKQWPNGYKKLKQMGFKVHSNDRQKVSEFGLKQLLNSCNEGLFRLLSQMLILNPKKRITSKQIVQNQYFHNVSNIIPPHIYTRFSKDFKKNSKKQIIENAQNAINHAKNALNKIHSNVKAVPSFIKQLNSPLNFNQSVNLNERMKTQYVTSARFGVKDGQLYSKDVHERERADEEQRQQFKVQLRQTQPQNNQQHIQQVLSFRGFNTIKTNKLSINEMKKFNQSRSKQKFYTKNYKKPNEINNISNTSYHDTSLKKNTISKSIDLGNRVIYTMSNPPTEQQPMLITQRKLTQDMNRNNVSQQKSFLENNNSQTVYIPNNTRTTPVKYYQNFQRGMQTPTKNLSILSNNESIRITRNNSIINHQYVQHNHNLNKNSNIIMKDSNNNSIIKERASYSPMMGLSPVVNNRGKIQLVSFKQDDSSLYNKKLHEHLSQKNLLNNTPIKNVNYLHKEHPPTLDRSKDNNISKNEFYTLLKKHNQDPKHPHNFKQRDNIMKVKMNQVKNKYNPLKTQASPNNYPHLTAQHQTSPNKLKNVKSLQRKDYLDNVNLGMNNDKFSLNQMKFIKVNDVKNYREPCITMKKTFQPYNINKNVPQFYSNEPDRNNNININLNVSIIQAEKNGYQVNRNKNSQQGNRI